MALTLTLDEFVGTLRASRLEMIIALLLAASLSPCRVIHARYEAPAALLQPGWSAERVQLALATIVVPHPNGPVLIDPALGSQSQSDLRELPFWLRLQFPDLQRAPRLPASIVPQAILLTHAHWDHLSGAADWPAVPILLHRLELDWARALTREDGYARGVLQLQLRRSAPRLRPFSFSRPTYDVLGDGSIIALQLPGHTPGSVGYLVSDWLFIGDALWRREGEKSRLASAVDEDAAEAARTRESLRALLRERPKLRIVPAHDAKALEELPACEGLNQ